MPHRTTKPARPANRFAARFAAAELEMPAVTTAITQYVLAADDPESEGLSRAFASGYCNLEDAGSDARYAYSAIISRFHPEIDF